MSQEARRTLLAWLTGRNMGNPAADSIMIELLRTNDIVLLSLVEALLTGADCDYFVADRHMSVLEGSTGFMAPRVLVVADQAWRARRVLCDAGLDAELTDD